MSRDSTIGNNDEYDPRTTFIPCKLVEEKNKKALEEKLLSFFPGGVVMTRTVVGELYKIEGLVLKGSENFNLLKELQKLELVMEE
ncbi:hypothetical protein FGADI_903 [Fusarium gaditjirri]|uniref:Uncharacterized protein n=1 Tax=Fusarium gaditjirri TaxID=282569 RepID=A0A8H4X4A9_9HYPO|nr:hypothetical protein FGADI_903 [Fusarium gaditjirri]